MSNAYISNIEINENIYSIKDAEARTDIEQLKENVIVKTDGKDLSSNDFTNEYKSAIDNLPTSYAPTDAQANVIESIKVNGAAVAISNKEVDITVPTKASDIGALPDTTNIPTVSDTYSAISEDAMSGKAVANAIGTKQDTLATQTVYTSKGTSKKVPQITTNSLGQVTNITEVDIEGGSGSAEFTGTQAEYETALANGEITDGMTVYITDDIKTDNMFEIVSRLNNDIQSIKDDYLTATDPTGLIYTGCYTEYVRTGILEYNGRYSGFRIVNNDSEHTLNYEIALCDVDGYEFDSRPIYSGKILPNSFARESFTINFPEYYNSNKFQYVIYVGIDDDANGVIERNNAYTVHLEGHDVKASFKFSVDGEGNYGYLKADGSFVPFKVGNIIYSTFYNITSSSYSDANIAHAVFSSDIIKEHPNGFIVSRPCTLEFTFSSWAGRGGDGATNTAYLRMLKDGEIDYTLNGKANTINRDKVTRSLSAGDIITFQTKCSTATTAVYSICVEVK